MKSNTRLVSSILLLVGITGPVSLQVVNGPNTVSIILSFSAGGPGSEDAHSATSARSTRSAGSAFRNDSPASDKNNQRADASAIIPSSLSMSYTIQSGFLLDNSHERRHGTIASAHAIRAPPNTSHSFQIM